jgi:osomolarity two-component system response regulator SKN7
MRVNEMESRMRMLEENLLRAMEEAAEARNREIGMMGVLREVVGQLASNERGEV